MEKTANGFDFTKIANNDFEIFGNKGVINPDKRVLIIGLGGTGTDTLLTTKDTILNRFDLKGEKFPKNIELLALDTDKSILDKSIGTTKIEAHEFIQMSDPNIAAAMQDKDNKMPDFNKNWVNPSLVIPPGVTPGTDGAGAIRQIGRYLLISNYKSVYNAISAKIKSVMTEAPNGGLTDIIILSGISGGTGSGTFIDMGYIVRKVCSDMSIGDLQKQITAYLYLPDVNIGNPNVPQASHTFIKCNGYAALKDLDYFMSIPHKKQVSSRDDAEKTYKFIQSYEHSTTIESEDAPFDATYLISGVHSAINPVKDAYEYSINITADSIVNFIADRGSIAGHTGSTQQGVQAVDINGAAMVASNPSIKKADGTDLLGNYDYKIIGASMASLPMKEITDYIAGEFLKKIDILKNQKPVAQDYQKLYKTVGLSLQRLAENVYKMVGNMNVALTGSNFKNDPNSSNQILSKNLAKYLGNAKANIPSYAETVVVSLENSLINQIDTAFSDINQGPFFANALMAEPQNGVIAQLVSMATKLLNQSNSFSTDASKHNMEAQNIYAAAGSAVMGKTKKYQQYIDERIAEYRSMVYAEICKELSDKINNATKSFGKSSLVDRIRQKNKDVYDVYTQILSTLAKRFGSDGTKVTTRNTGRVFVWNIVKIGDVAPNIKNSIGTMDLDHSLNNLLIDMVKNSQRWCNSNTALSEFGEFLNTEFQTILGQSMDEFLKSLDSASLQTNIQKLDNDAKVHFPSNPAVSSEPSNIYDKVTVPANAPKINEAIVTYLKNKGSQKEPEQSLLYERISWVRVCIGVPLFQYVYLQSYEDAYEKMNPNNKQGMHLYENKGIHGTSYPAILPSEFWENGYKNRREQERYEKMTNMFEKAESLGLVGYMPNSAYLVVTPEGWIEKEIEAVLAKYSLTSDSMQSLCLTMDEIQSCIAELNAVRNKTVSETHVYLPDTAGYDSNPKETRYYAVESFSRMPEAGEMLANEIKKREKIDDIVKVMEEALNAFGEEKGLYMAFVYSFIFDIIQSQGAKCVYNTDSEIVELSNKFSDKFWRYKAFGEFERVIYPMEKENIEKKINAATDSNEQLSLLLGTCQKTVKDLAAELKGIALLDDSAQNSDIKSFYNRLRMFLNDEIEKFRNIGIE